jgi:hypothetical protein
MAGYMVAELWCDDCLERTQTEDQGTLRDLRASLREEGWRRVRPAGGGRLIDLCEHCVQKAARLATEDKAGQETQVPTSGRTD